MDRTIKYSLGVLASALCISSCCNNAKIDGTLADASEVNVLVKVMDANAFKTDTVKTDKNGHYTCKLPVAKGQPEFVYLYYGDTKVASLLLQRGDKVKVSSDTMGVYSVTGSDETSKLIEVEKDEAEFTNKFLSLSAKLVDLDPSSAEAADVQKQVTKLYVDYYRSRVKYVLTNSHSLTSIPVLYQNVNGELPVFGQVTDVLHFKSVYDSLMTVYPQSVYVKSLGTEVERRQNILNLNAKVSNAEQLGFPDFEMNDNKGVSRKLGDVVAENKVVMLFFWSSSASDHKLFNVDVLKPVYEEFEGKGFEIYSVCTDSDKSSWAVVVRNQNLPWVNVCDGLGANSRVLGLYNVSTVPATFFIVDGMLTPAPGVKDAETLKAFIRRNL